MSAPASPDLVMVLTTASDTVRRQCSAIAALTADACARRFEVEAHALFVPGKDRTSARGRRMDLARACAVSLLHTGAGWTQEQAGDRFGLDRRAVQKTVRRVADLRDGDTDLDAWLEALERALQGEA